MNFRRNILILFCLLGALNAYGQSRRTSKYVISRAIIIEGDTVLFDHLPTVYIYPPLSFSSEKEYLKYKRLIRDLKKVYPYSRLASDLLREMNDRFLSLSTEKQKKAYVNEVEKQLRSEFEEELKGLTIKQGRLLIKLIDRETGANSYNLVRELKGAFSAFFWQALAKLFGSDLKTNYDPTQGEDRIIEQILIRIESGQL